MIHFGRPCVSVKGCGYWAPVTPEPRLAPMWCWAGQHGHCPAPAQGGLSDQALTAWFISTKSIKVFTMILILLKNVSILFLKAWVQYSVVSRAPLCGPALLSSLSSLSLIIARYRPVFTAWHGLTSVEMWAARSEHHIRGVQALTFNYLWASHQGCRDTWSLSFVTRVTSPGHLVTMSHCQCGCYGNKWWW